MPDVAFDDVFDAAVSCATTARHLVPATSHESHAPDPRKRGDPPGRLLTR